MGNKTEEGYIFGVAEIARRGISLQAIGCDGRKGRCVVQTFLDLPIQFCQFHQIKTATKYLTRKPKLATVKKPRAISLKLVGSTEVESIGMLDAWKEKWKDMLKERSTNEEPHKPL